MRGFNYYSRKAHRYLGLVIGIQFLLWTTGGIFFSWTDIREIRGEHLMANRPVALVMEDFAISPKDAAAAVRSAIGTGEIQAIRTAELLGEPYYEIAFENGEVSRFLLVSATNGQIRQPVTEEEVRRIAAAALNVEGEIAQVRYLEEQDLGLHHEYRGGTLPAWAVDFKRPDGLTIYVSGETGRVGAFRTNNWRVYDFLWMLHTMGYENRDDFNNYILRGFALFGIATVITGFVLFFITSRTLRRMLRRDAFRRRL